MYKYNNLLLFFLLALITPAIAQEKDSTSKLPAVNYTRSKNIDVKHIAIDLRFDWQKRQAYGTATITCSPFSKADSIKLDAGMLTINSISLLNGTSLKYKYDGTDRDDALVIALDRTYEANTDLTIKIDYHTNWINESDPNNLGGSLGKGLRFIEPSATAPIKRRQIWSMGETRSNRYWFPGYDDINDLRTTEFTATVDKGLSVFSNGTLVEKKELADGKNSFHWKMDRPYPNYLTSFVVGEYVDVRQQYQDIALHSYCYPDEKEATEATTERLPDMVRFFSEKTGMKYPYNSYSQVFVQDHPYPGLTPQSTISTISDNMVDDYRTHKDFLYLWDGIEADALAGQWFGNLLMPRDWSEAWLSKSFCHYFDGLYTTYKNGKDEFLVWYYFFYEQPAVIGDWQAGYRRPLVTPYYDNVDSHTSDNYTRIRGALVLRMLQQQLGEELWWKAIRHYVKKNANKEVGTEDFRIAIEEATGQSMGWFFDQWVYKTGMPKFEINKQYDPAKKELTLTVSQLQKPDNKDPYPQVDLFKGKVNIEIDGKIETIWLEPKTTNTYVFNYAKEPGFVNFDYESNWIKEITFEKGIDELLYQLQNSKDVLAKYAAIDTLSARAKDTKILPADKQKILAAFRSTVLNDASYWRLKVYTLINLRPLLTVPYDEPTVSMLLTTIKKDSAWVRANAISGLGLSKDPKYADIFINALNDQSDRVINTAAIALGRSKSPKAYNALVKLKDKPSWKSQSLISALNGLQQLGDARGAAIALKALEDIHSPRWFLAVAAWDYPIVAAQTLVALGKGSTGFPVVFERFKTSMKGNDVNDIFSNMLLIAILGDPRGEEAVTLLKERFKNDANAMNAVQQYETQLKAAIKKP